MVGRHLDHQGVADAIVRIDPEIRALWALRLVAMSTLLAASCWLTPIWVASERSTLTFNVGASGTWNTWESTTPGTPARSRASLPARPMWHVHPAPICGCRSAPADRN